MPIPSLFTSPKVSLDLTKFGPSHWNTVTALLRGLFDGADADGTVLTRSAASALGAAWQVPAAVTKASIGLGSVENTALSTWAGSANLTSLGPITVTPGAVLITTDVVTLKTGTGVSSGVEIRSAKAGTDNTFMGLATGSSTATGIDNTAFGHGSMAFLTTGLYNTACGQGPLWALTTGQNNVAVGVWALRGLTTGSSNTAVGFQALAVNDASNNTAVGSQALCLATAGFNTAVGYESGFNVAGGAQNTYIGSYGGSTNVSGNNNVAVGYLAGGLHLGSGNVFLGSSAGYFETGSNSLYVDNVTRASLADAKVKALVYGVFDAAVANQFLVVNGALRPLSIAVGDGTGPLPSLAFLSEPTLGLYRYAATAMGLTGSLLASANITAGSTLNAAQVNASSGTAAFRSSLTGTVLSLGVADGTAVLRNNGDTLGVRLKFDALPTVASGFGAGAAVTAGSTPLAGSVNTGAISASGVINFNGTAFPAAPFVVCQNLTTGLAVKYTATATQLTLSPATGNFAANDVIAWHCISAKS